MKLSIKLRVTLLCTLLTATVAVLALNVLLLGEVRIEEKYYHNMLVSTAELARNDVFYEDGDLQIDRNLDDLPGVRISLYTPDGDLIYGRRWLEQPFEAGGVRRIQGTGGEWFVYDVLLDFEAEQSVWLRCMCSADAVAGVRTGSGRLALWLIPSLILTAGLGGYGIARRAFRPVAKIVRTAEGIAGGADLKKRIGLTGAKDELYDLAHTFDAMFERLDDAFERERRFTSDVSHELRTPVASILAQSEFALSENAAEADRMEALAAIREKAGGMAELIRRLLVLARMDAGTFPLTLEQVNLGLLAELAAESMEEAAKKRNMSVDTTGCADAEITGDQTMLMQAVLNLIENAVRYGREGGHVRIATGNAAGETMLSVSDDGPGVAEEDIPRLFERFYQADSSRSGEGSGLGLSLVQRIVQLHGGCVEVRSAPGEGCRFTMVFPGKEDAS